MHPTGIRRRRPVGEDGVELVAPNPNPKTVRISNVKTIHLVPDGEEEGWFRSVSPNSMAEIQRNGARARIDEQGGIELVRQKEAARAARNRQVVEDANRQLAAGNPEQEALLGRGGAADEEFNEDGRWNPDDEWDDTILRYARGVGIAILVGFGVLYVVARLGRSGGGGSGGGRNLGEGSPETGSAFGASCGLIRAAHEPSESGDQDGAWTGSAQARHAAWHNGLRDLGSQMADTDQAVQAVVRTQSEQVTGGRETLGNVLNGVDLAIPVAHALYFSGPVGPVLSYHFQMGVAGSALGTSADAVNTMHESAQQNGERLDALAQGYDEMLGRLCELGTSS